MASTPITKPPIWQQEYKNEDGSIDVWKYNTNITRAGPIEVTHIPAKKELIPKNKKSKFIKQ